jgi:hypothetical protein
MLCTLVCYQHRRLTSGSRRNIVNYSVVYPTLIISDHWGPLSPYEAFAANYRCLASFGRLDSLTSQALDDFRLQPRQSLRFELKRWNRTINLLFNRQMPYHSAFFITYYNVLPQLLHNLLDYKIQHVTIPFASRATQKSFTTNVQLVRLTTNRSNCILALRCDPSNANTTFSHTD